MRYRLVVPLLRSPHSVEYTARGVANGCFWGLTPSVGFQYLAICGTWFVARSVFRKDSSLVQALAWAWLNNPLTMIPMYFVFYVTGLWLLGQAGRTPGYDAFVGLWNAGSSLGWGARLQTLAASVGLPMIAGSLPYATIGSALAYRWTTALLRGRRRRAEPGGTKHEERRTKNGTTER